MAEYSLISDPPLAGYDKDFGSVRLKAPKDLAIVSVALPLGGETAAEKAVKAAYGVDLPEVGKSVVSPDNGAAVMRLGRDLAFVLFSHPTPDAEPLVAKALKGKAYTTDQTDVWVALELKGEGSRDALERICPLDLHDSAFAVHDAQRTVMEHLGVIIVRTEADTWLLLSASSSAGSFLHAVEISIKNAS